jgi:hypothetical protein
MNNNSKLKFSFNATINIELTESEAKALDAIAGYGSNVFLDVFYRKLGKHYLKPHENGLISLFDKVRTELPGQVDKVNRAKKYMNETLKNLS